MKMKNSMKGLAGLLGVGVVALGLGEKADAGTIYLKNNTVTSGIGTSSLNLRNISGATDEYGYGDVTFINPVQTNALQIYSIIPGLGGDDKAGVDAHAIDTFGWDFYLGVKGNVSGIDNYLRYKVTDTTDLDGKTLEMYDVSNPLNKYELLMDNAYHNVSLPNLTHGAGEYAHWRLDIGSVPEPSSAVLAATGAIALGGFGVYNLMRRRKESEAKE